MGVFSYFSVPFGLILVILSFHKYSIVLLLNVVTCGFLSSAATRYAERSFALLPMSAVYFSVLCFASDLAFLDTGKGGEASERPWLQLIGLPRYDLAIT